MMMRHPLAAILIVLVCASALGGSALAHPGTHGHSAAHGKAGVHGGGHPAPVTKITFKLASHEVVLGEGIDGTLLFQSRSGHSWISFGNAPFSVNVDGVQVYAGTTDANGQATIAYVAGSAGGHVMKVSFAGDDAHKRAQRAQGFEVVPATS